MASALATATSALVTGGALGLGRAAAARIVGAGGTVCIFDFDEEKGKATAKELGASAIFQQGDVRDPAAVAHALEAMVSAFGRVDAAVSCAGIAPPAKTLGKKGPHSLALFEDVLGVNAVGTFNVARLAAAAMANNEPDAAGMRGAASARVFSRARFERRSVGAAASCTRRPSRPSTARLARRPTRRPRPPSRA